MTLSANSPGTAPANETGLPLGIGAIALLALFLIAIFIVGFPLGRFGQDLGTVLLGLYLMLWGGMFLASYYYSHKSFFFRGLIWVCEILSSPASRKMAFFYCAIFLIGGGIVLLTGLGLA